MRAARKYNAAIAECYYNGSEVVLDVKETGKLAGKKAQLQVAQPDDVALVLHTSGTTGRPKAVPLTHRNLLRTMKNIQGTYELTPKDRTMLVMPLFHVHGLLAGFLAPLASGGSVVVPLKLSATVFWKDFAEHKANWYTAVPTIHQILLKNPIPSPKPQIRFIRSCSSPLSPKTFHELEKALGAPVLEAYAMTEAAHQMTSNPLPPGQRKPGSVGLGQGVEVKILNDAGDEVPQGKEAEICIRGENVTKGYLNNPSANASSFTKGGFFRTGDQGLMDTDGYVIITGRIKELINKGGEKISPIELDNVIAQHPAVSEAVSFAIEDEMYGQNVGLAIVLKDGQTLNEGELRAWMSERLSKFKLAKKASSCHVSQYMAQNNLTNPRFSSPISCPRQPPARFKDASSPKPCSRKRRRKPGYSFSSPSLFDAQTAPVPYCVAIWDAPSSPRIDLANNRCPALHHLPLELTSRHSGLFLPRWRFTNPFYTTATLPLWSTDWGPSAWGMANHQLRNAQTT